MPKKSPPMTEPIAVQLESLGAQLVDQRKALRLSAAVVAEAAGMSRVTLHRIEKGEPSVNMGAWCSVVGALGMQLKIQANETVRDAQEESAGWWPVRIKLSDYSQLKALAWQVQGTDQLTPVEAFDIYERNAKHLDRSKMTQQEQALWQALQQAFGKRAADV